MARLWSGNKLRQSGQVQPAADRRRSDRRAPPVLSGRFRGSRSVSSRRCVFVSRTQVRGQAAWSVNGGRGCVLGVARPRFAIRRQLPADFRAGYFLYYFTRARRVRGRGLPDLSKAGKKHTALLANVNDRRLCSRDHSLLILWDRTPRCARDRLPGNRVLSDFRSTSPRLGWAGRDSQVSRRRIAARSRCDDLDARLFYGNSLRPILPLAAALEANPILSGSNLNWLTAALYVQRAELWQSIPAAECRRRTDVLRHLLSL